MELILILPPTSSFLPVGNEAILSQMANKAYRIQTPFDCGNASFVLQTFLQNVRFYHSANAFKMVRIQDAL